MARVHVFDPEPSARVRANLGEFAIEAISKLLIWHPHFTDCGAFRRRGLNQGDDHL